MLSAFKNKNAICSVGRTSDLLMTKDITEIVLPEIYREQLKDLYLKEIPSKVNVATKLWTGDFRTFVGFIFWY